MEIRIVSLENWANKKPWYAITISRFKSNYTETKKLLVYELEKLDAVNSHVQMEIPKNMIRSDGFLRAGSKPNYPGVILSFGSKFGQLSYPCDSYTEWECNLRAIALSLEHLRAINRYGVTSKGEQYRGWEALPEPKAEVQEAIDTLFKFSGIRVARQTDVHEAFRCAAMRAHPDKGGIHADFLSVVKAKEVLLNKLPL